MGDPDPSPGGSGLARGGKVDGTPTRRTLPTWMDPNCDYGELTLLRMEAIDGKLPRNPFTIRTSIDLCTGDKITGAFPESRGDFYTLKVRNPNHVRKLLSLTELVDKTNIRIIHHPTLNCSKCVVSCFDVIDIPDQELLSSLANQGVIGIRRFTRRDGSRTINTASMILTITGATPPAHIDFGYIRVNTRPYYPSPMLCYRCWEFGHTRVRCQATTVCGNCAGEHAQEENVTCPNTSFCRRCNSHEHGLNSRNCPAYRKEKEVQRLRVDHGLSYPAASRLYNNHNNTSNYANVVNASNETAVAKLMSKVEELQENLNERDEKIKMLEEKKNNRMEKVATNGTIEDLIKQINNLKEQAAKKDHENNVLKALLNSMRKLQHNESPTKDNTTSGQAAQHLAKFNEQLKTNKSVTKDQKNVRKQTNNQSTPKRNPSPAGSDRKHIKSKIPKTYVDAKYSDNSMESEEESLGGILGEEMDVGAVEIC